MTEYSTEAISRRLFLELKEKGEMPMKEFQHDLPEDILKEVLKYMMNEKKWCRIEEGIIKVSDSPILLNNSSEKYFSQEKSSGNFIPESLATDIMKDYSFLTLKDNEEIYWFDENEGIWKTNGETLIKKIGTDFLREKTKQFYLNETIGYIKAKTYEDRNKFDNPHLNLLPIKNGILKLDTLELIPYSKDYYFTSKLNVEYNPRIDCSQIKKFLSEIVVSDDIKLLVELAGYCLFRKYSIQKSFMLVGNGANGKSTYLQLLNSFLGQDNICAVSLQDLEHNRFSGSNLYRKLANIYADLPKIALRNPGTFKMLTGGDFVTGEKKFKNQFFFYNYAKLIFSANQVPYVEDDSNAFFRRWIIINFPNKFEGSKADTELLDKLTTPEEMSGFLNLALTGLKEVLNNNGFSYSKTTEEIREIYIKASDPIGAFVSECIVQSPEDFVEKDELYNSYSVYCRQRKCPVVDKSVFSKNFRKYCQVEHYRPSIGERRVQCWKGISLVNPVKDVNDNSHLNSLENITDNKMESKIDNPDTVDRKLGEYQK